VDYAQFLRKGFYTGAPRSRETVALANYVWIILECRVIPLYYHRRLSCVRYSVSLSGVYVIDETKVSYLMASTIGLLGTSKLRECLSSSSVRVGVHVLVVLANMKRAEEVVRRK
jgi:hypothetical protein